MKVLITKQTAVRHMWREHERNMNNLALTVFELLAHPDAADDDLKTARELAIKARAGHTDMVNRMRQAGFNVDAKLKK